MLKIGVDGGGTTTRAVIIEQQDGSSEISVLARAEAASSNHYGVGLETTGANILEAINKALETAGISRTDVAGIGFGLAGACTNAEQTILTNTLAPLLSGSFLVVDEDAAGAQSGAFAGAPGAVCIAGTGANCFGVNEKGERARADGLGPLLGDRGGGYRIGEAALRAICAANDGSGMETRLLESCLQALEVKNVDELVQLVYQPDFTRSQIAALFPIVLQEERNGDVLARQLLTDAGRDLAFTVCPVLQKLELNRVAIVGGVFENSDVVRRHFESELDTYMSASAVGNVEVIAPQYDAAIGAALLVKN